MNKVSIGIVSVVLVLVLSGCGNGSTYNEDMNVGIKSLEHNTSSMVNRYDHKMNMKSNHVRKHQSMLTQHIRSIDGVTDSTLIVDNENIIVGLDIAHEADKAKVEEKVRSLLLKDQNGQNVYVTSDNALHQRIRNLGNGITETDSPTLNNITNDIKVLIEDIGKSIHKAVK